MNKNKQTKKNIVKGRLMNRDQLGTTVRVDIINANEKKNMWVGKAQSVTKVDATAEHQAI